jgi:hypothetical protein
MPDAFYRLLALPNGIAMIGLGYSLWRTTRTNNDDALIGDHHPHRMPNLARRGIVRGAWVWCGDTEPVSSTGCSSRSFSPGMFRSSSTTFGRGR